MQKSPKFILFVVAFIIGFLMMLVCLPCMLCFCCCPCCCPCACCRKDPNEEFDTSQFKCPLCCLAIFMIFTILVAVFGTS